MTQPITTRANGQSWTFDESDRAERDSMPEYGENWQRRHYGANANRAADLTAAKILAERSGDMASVYAICDELDRLALPEFSPLVGPRCPHCAKLFSAADVAHIDQWKAQLAPPLVEIVDCAPPIIVDMALSDLFAE